MDMKEINRLTELARNIVLLTINKTKLDNQDITLVHDYADMILDALVDERMRVIKKKHGIDLNKLFNI